jgi:hypothetical protein
MSPGPEGLRVPKHTFKTTANSTKMELDPDSFMRFPAELSPPVKAAKKAKTIYSAYTHNPAEDEENIERGRYLGKDRYLSRRIDTHFMADSKKEPAVEFNTSTKTGAMSWIMRERGDNANAGAGDAEEGNDPATIAPGTKRKRATCAGPDRVKRSYTWRDGGKRAGEAGVQKKLEENKSKGGNLRDAQYMKGPKAKRAKRASVTKRGSGRIKVVEDDEDNVSADNGKDQDEYQPRGGRGGRGGLGGRSAATS